MFLQLFFEKDDFVASFSYLCTRDTLNIYEKRHKKDMRKTFLTLACLLLTTMSWAQADADHNFKVAKNLEVFNTIYRNLDMMYVDTLDADEVVG